MSLTLAMNVTEGDKPRSERRMRWLGKDAWGFLLSGRWTAAMVSGAGKGTGFYDMSVGRGGGVGMVVGAVSVGDGVGLSGRGSYKGGIRV